MNSVHRGGQKRLRPCKFSAIVFTQAQFKIHDVEQHEKVDEDLLEEHEKPDPEAIENHECKKCELAFASYKILQMHEVWYINKFNIFPHFFSTGRPATLPAGPLLLDCQC